MRAEVFIWLAYLHLSRRTGYPEIDHAADRYAGLATGTLVERLAWHGKVTEFLDIATTAHTPD